MSDPSKQEKLPIDELLEQLKIDSSEKEEFVRALEKSFWESFWESVQVPLEEENTKKQDK
jgi:hypothetical protein